MHDAVVLPIWRNKDVCFKIGQYLMNLRRTKLRCAKSVPVFWGHPVCDR